MNHDEAVFPNPDEFIPERFLDANGEFSVSNKPVLPFGIGRRVCPGADFAKTMLFMFAVTLIQRFKFSRTTAEKLPYKDFMGLRHECSPFNLMVTHRQ